MKTTLFFSLLALVSIAGISSGYEYVTFWLGLLGFAVVGFVLALAIGKEIIT